MNQQDILNNSIVIYQQIKSKHPSIQIYSSKDLRHILSWYITNGNLRIDKRQQLCHLYYELSEGTYYHLLPHFKIIQYDSWLLKQVRDNL